MDLALCSAHSHLQTVNYKVGSTKLFKFSLYCEAFTINFIGTKRPDIAPEKQPHTIISLDQTLHNAVKQVACRCPGNHQTQFRPLEPDD